MECASFELGDTTIDGLMSATGPQQRSTSKTGYGVSVKTAI